MPGPWVLRTVLLLAIASAVVGFSFPANFGSVAGYKGANLSSPEAKSGGIWWGKAKHGYFSPDTRLAGPWPRRHRAVAIEGIDTKNTGESSPRERWGDQSNKDDDISYAKMLKFILPTLGIWLASPIMGLIDAGVIGTRSALELAALGPATVLCESLIYFSTFLAVATTNLQATALANHDRLGAQKVVAEALGLALAIGLIVATFVQLWGPQVLTRLAGEKSTEVIPAALMYSRVRILGAPASIAAMVLQAACLGARDSATPLGVVLVASAVNALGDWWSVCRMGMGIFGAAAATASAEMVSMVLLGVVVWKAQGERLHRFIVLPSREELKVFLDFAGPIAFALFGKIICYSAMTLAVTSLGMIPLATHNVMMRFFFFFGTFGEALSQTAQAFIPGQLARERNMKAVAVMDGDDGLASTDVEVRREAAGLSPSQTITRKVLTLGVVVGSVNACVAGLIPLRFPHLFTNSLDVAAGMRSLVPLMSWSLLSHAVVLALEGIILARRSLRFLANCYAVNTVVIVSFLQWVKTWPAAQGLHGVWSGLLLLQLLRVGELGIHLVMLDRCKTVDGEAAAE